MKRVTAMSLTSAFDDTPLRCLLVEPLKHPRITYVSGRLPGLQQAVGGNIACISFFNESVYIIRRKAEGDDCLTPNRTLRDEKGWPFDVISGSFLILGKAGVHFSSLTQEQSEKYAAMFYKPEVFLKTDTSVSVVSLNDKELERYIKLHEMAR